MNNTNATIITIDLNINESSITFIILLLVIFGLIAIYFTLKYCCLFLKHCCIITMICCDYGYEFCSYCDKPKIKRFIIEISNIPFGTVISPSIINKFEAIV